MKNKLPPLRLSVPHSQGKDQVPDPADDNPPPLVRAVQVLDGQERGSNPHRQLQTSTNSLTLRCPLLLPPRIMDLTQACLKLAVSGVFRWPRTSSIHPCYSIVPGPWMDLGSTESCKLLDTTLSLPSLLPYKDGGLSSPKTSHLVCLSELNTLQDETRLEKQSFAEDVWFCLIFKVPTNHNSHWDQRADRGPNCK